MKGFSNTYFGARYYTNNIMMWLSVDPMSDERPWISPYNYCQWNPIGRVDTWAWPQPEYKYAIKPQVPITYEEGMDRIRKYINERQ